MSDNEQKPFATAGSGKSDTEVAFDLLNKLKGQGIWGEKNKSDILDMYAECLDAVKGYRVYEGQNRLIAPVRKVMNQAIVNPNAGATAVTQRAQAPHAHNPVPTPQQQAPQQQAQSNPVQAQQQQIQQQIQRQG